MPTPLYVALFMAVWVGGGLAAAVYLGRRGHRSPFWYVLGALMGLLFVPIALERARRDTRRLETSSGASTSASAADRLTVVVGVDGSPESERVIDEVQRVFTGQRPQLVLVSVVDQDAEQGGKTDIADSRDRLARCADRLSRDLPDPATEVVAGAPAQALLDVAEAHDADVIAVGRRGTGLSKRVLGSVADQIVQGSSRAVLLGRPPTDRG